MQSQEEWASVAHAGKSITPDVGSVALQGQHVTLVEVSGTLVSESVPPVGRKCYACW